MTLQQLKYVVATAEKGTVSEAAQSRFFCERGRTKAIPDLVKAINLTIIIGTNQGIKG